jgi:hypothetical protein
MAQQIARHFGAAMLSGLGMIANFQPSAAASMRVAAATQEGVKQEDEKQKREQKPKDAPPRRRFTKEERSALIKRAQIWLPRNIAEMNLKLGPQDEGAFQPGEEVSCDYVPDEDPAGTTRKFNCAISKDDVVKVRYGEDNGKVEGAVLATRLLWALGYGADHVYPVRVRCRGCSADPWKDRKVAAGEQLFDHAAIDRKPKGEEIKVGDNNGWAWQELGRIDERQGGAPKEQRDALKLLAVFMQHTDNKPEQERLICLPAGKTDDGGCSKPFMYLHDVGLTFGHANLFDEGDRSSVNFEEWAATPIWRDEKACVGHMRRSSTGTLGDPQISEAGRKFLADLLMQLTDQQLHDLFEGARVDRRSRKPGTAAPPASVDDWMNVFKQKRDEIVNNHCKS